jgi:hypothetical protein
LRKSNIISKATYEKLTAVMDYFRVSIWVSLNRQFGARLKEHQKAISTLDKGKSALAEHVCDNKHEIAWENSNY